MTSTWLPLWLALAWAAVFMAIAGVHVWHVLAPAGLHRLWHLVHVLMAAGMVLMLVPAAMAAIPVVYGGLTFALAAVLIAVLLVRERSYRRPVGVLWLAAVVDLAAMAYMFAMMSYRLLGLTVVLIAWFVLQAVSWAGGRPLGGGSPPRPPEAISRPMSLRISLCAMCIGMAYMLVVMQWGTSVMVVPSETGGAPGMPGMPGM